LASFSLLVSTVAIAHDPERTQVTLTFARDGSFVLDVANDPNWLRTRMEPFKGDFIDRVVLWVDGREVRPSSAELILPRSEDGLATYRLRGKMPNDARSLRWYYGLVIDPYPLTINRADGRTITETIQGDAWSGTIDLSRQFVSPLRARTERALPIAALVAVFALALSARLWTGRRAGWNRNLQYHDLVLNAAPRPCGRALDVGCGTGQLARRLAERCGDIVAIDADAEVLARARAETSNTRIQFVHGDVLTYPLPDGEFDFIAAIASLHHMELTSALVRFDHLLRPGGTLVVIGLYRNRTLSDWIAAAIALPARIAFQSVRGTAVVAAPIQEPKDSLAEIQNRSKALLPGSSCRRLLHLRYALVWRKPVAEIRRVPQSPRAPSA